MEHRFDYIAAVLAHADANRRYAGTAEFIRQHPGLFINHPGEYPKVALVASGANARRAIARNNGSPYFWGDPEDLLRAAVQVARDFGQEVME